MNKLSATAQAAIVRCLAEGNSVRATARLTGTSKATVLKLLVELGDFCSFYQDQVIRNLPTTRVEADEIWAFVGAKQKRATRHGDGDIWTYTAIDSDSKLMITWLVGARNTDNATEFMKDLRDRCPNRLQLTTDGHDMYPPAVERAFGWNRVDYAQLVKTYGHPSDDARRYSPPVCTGAKKEPVMGRPAPEHISTSYVERANLSIRMQQRRFARLTNAFSKKAENHAHAVSFYFMWYNFCRVHQTVTKAAKGIHTTPAMAAGLTDRVWTAEDLVAALDPRQPLHSN